MSLRLIQSLVVLAVAACGPVANGSDSARAADASGATADTAAKPFTVKEIASFDEPWAMTFLPGSGLPLTNSALVTEKTGHVWLVDVGTGKKVEVRGVPTVLYGGQGGLLDIVASPGFAGDQLVYLTYAKPDGHGGSSLALARAKFALGDGAPRFQEVQVIWADPQGGDGGQFGGRIAFAPDGQSVFLTSGDRQRFTPAQDPDQPLGKVLHLTLDGKPAPDNPWFGKTGSQVTLVTDPPEDTQAAKKAPERKFTWTRPNLTPAETWSVGHRTPYGLAFGPDGRLWEAEAGPQGGDELNLIGKGRNYGWPLVSYGVNYNGVPIPKPPTRPDLEAPKVWWTPTVTPGGLLIYSGDKFPQWKGDALIPALNGEALIRIAIDGDSARKANQWAMGSRMRGIAQGPDGAVYLLQDGDGAKLLRLDPVR
jgi:glucose/arabinose dehydrogenase